MIGKTVREVLRSMVTMLRPWPARHIRKAAVRDAIQLASAAAEDEQRSEAARARAAKAEREISRMSSENPAITSELVRNLRGAK